ncbi:MAG: hypothetical protein R2854_10090 [Caldilineaceae bacterium]
MDAVNQDHARLRRWPSSGPDGVDVYFDNVGGDRLEAAPSAQPRRAACGMISPVQRH